MGKVHCSKCNKCMTNKDGSSFIGISFSILNTNGNEEFIKAQWGKHYQGFDTKLNFCWECWIDSLIGTS